MFGDCFPELAAPETDRRVLQLTDGSGFCYPLYYYVPSLTGGGRLVYHRAEGGEVQLYSLDLATGETVRLTDAASEDAQWRPWCTDPGSGVLDHRSALNVARGEVLYFDGRDARRVDVATGADATLFTLPEGRRAIGQNCVTPDGDWFVYIHHDRALFEKLFDEAGNQAYRHRSEGTVLAAYHLDTGEHRTLVRINSPIHHVLPYGEHLVFCHPATENGMLLTDLEGGWYSHLRTRDGDGGAVCHYLATARGLAYEVLGGQQLRAGLYEPFTHDRVEFDLPGYFGYTHTGYDPDGKLFFYETAGDYGHELRYLVCHRPDGADDWARIVGDWPTYGGGQKAHFHPRMTPDRDWIVFVAGDDETATNQIYAVDVADLSHSRGLAGVP